MRIGRGHVQSSLSSGVERSGVPLVVNVPSVDNSGSHKRRGLSVTQRIALGIAGTFVAGSLVGAYVDSHLNSARTGPNLPSQGTVSKSPESAKTISECHPIVAPAESSPAVSDDSVLEIGQTTDYYYDAMNISNALVTRVDRTVTDTTIYIKIPGKLGETWVKRQDLFRGQEYYSLQLTGVELGFRVCNNNDAGVSGLTASEVSEIDALARDVKAGDRVGSITTAVVYDELNYDPQGFGGPNWRQREEVTAGNIVALDQLRVGVESGTQTVIPVFTARSMGSLIAA